MQLTISRIRIWIAVMWTVATTPMSRAVHTEIGDQLHKPLPNDGAVGDLFDMRGKTVLCSFHEERIFDACLNSDTNSYLYNRDSS